MPDQPEPTRRAAIPAPVAVNLPLKFEMAAADRLVELLNIVEARNGGGTFTREQMTIRYRPEQEG